MKVFIFESDPTEAQYLQKMIADILEGADPAAIAVRKMSEMSVYVNKETAKALNIEIPQAILDKAVLFPEE